MTRRSHFNRLVFDNATGHVDTTATIRVYKPGTTDPIADTIYTSRNGGTTRAQGWTTSDGEIDFYLETPQEVAIGITQGVTETVKDYLAVGMVYGDDNVLTYDVRGDGTRSATDNTAALQEALDTMDNGSVRYFPAGEYQINDTLKIPTTLESWSISGAGPGGTNRLPPSYLRAANGANLSAMMATEEWLSDGSVQDIGQGWAIKELGFWGGGFTAGSVHDTVIETTANTLHGLVVHGSGWKLIDVTVVSTNGHGIYIPGVGQDGVTALTKESHENQIRDAAVRYTGGSGIYAGTNGEDSWVRDAKIQYCGEHCINITRAPGWSFMGCHPSWGARDIIHVETAWQNRLIGNYVGSIGRYMDGLAVPGRSPGDTRYGIYVDGGPAHVHANSNNDNAQTAQSDPIVGYRLHAFKGSFIGNSLIANAGDTATLVDASGSDSANYGDFGNKIFAS